MFLSSIVASVFWFLEGAVRSAEGAGGGGKRDNALFMTSVEVAQMLKMSPRTLEKMRLESRGPKYYRLGENGKSKVLYLYDEVIEWVRGHGNKSP